MCELERNLKGWWQMLCWSNMELLNWIKSSDSTLLIFPYMQLWFLNFENLLSHQLFRKSSHVIWCTKLGLHPLNGPGLRDNSEYLQFITYLLAFSELSLNCSIISLYSDSVLDGSSFSLFLMAPSIFVIFFSACRFTPSFLLSIGESPTLTSSAERLVSISVLSFAGSSFSSSSSLELLEIFCWHIAFSCLRHVVHSFFPGTNLILSVLNC